MELGSGGDADDCEAEVIEPREPPRGAAAQDAEDMRATYHTGDEVAADAREPGLGERLADVIGEHQHERRPRENLNQLRPECSLRVVVPVRR